MLTPDVDSMPWWAYAILAGSLMLVAGFAWALRAFFRHYVIDTVPKETVELLIRAKDAEIERARRDAADWRGAFQIKDAAFTDLAQTIDDLTDALAAGNRQSQPRTEGQSNGRGARPVQRRQ